MTEAKWVKEAPKRVNPIVVASTVSDGDHIVSAVSMAFQGIKDADMTTVTLLGSEWELRKFQKDLDRAITLALREVR